MILKDCVKEALTVKSSTTVQEAARMVVEKRIGTLPVVDDGGTLVGVVRLTDLLKVFMPNFVSIMVNIDFVTDFGALENLYFKDMPEIAHLTVKSLMAKPILVPETCGLLRAFAIMDKNQFMDLIVTDDDGKLTGIASRVDIAAAFLSTAMEGGNTTT